MLVVANKNVFKIMKLRTNLVLISRFQARNLVFCSLYIMFSAKIPFVKISTRIVKYESRVVKSNAAEVELCFNF